MVETRDDLEVVATCEDLDSLMEAVETERPEVVVTDIRMPRGYRPRRRERGRSEAVFVEIELKR